MQRAQGKHIPSWQQVRFITKVLTSHQKIWFRVATVVLVFSAVLLSGGFLSQFRSPEPKVGGEYVEGVVGEPHLINPLFATLNETDLGLTRLVYSGLMRSNGQQEIVPDMAADYTISPDKKIYTFNLMPDVRWHDGEPVTARDVVFTFELLQDSAVSSPMAATFTGIKVLATNDHTVQFSLPDAYPAFLSTLTMGILPEHVWSGIPRDQVRFAEINLKPIGSGPFQFKRLVRESDGFIPRYELARYPGYYRQTAYIQDLVFQFYSDYEGDAGALEALRTQKVAGLSFIPVALKDKTATKHVQLTTLQLPQYTALFFNLNAPGILADKDVRQALAVAINKPKILQETLHNDGAAIDGPLLPGSPGFTSPKFESGLPDDANALLDKKWPRISADEYRKKLIVDYVQAHTTTTSPSTGLEVNTSTLAREAAAEVDKVLPAAQLFYRTDKDKKIISLDLVTADTPEYRHVAGLVAGYWQDIGIKTNITFVNQKDIARTTFKDRDYDVLLYGVIVGADPDQFPFWHSSQIKYPGLNLSGYTNHKVDDVLEKIRQTTDASKLNDLYAQLEIFITGDVPAVFLYSPTYTYVLGNQVKGFNVQRITHPADRFANITDWYLKIGSHWDFKK